ncbi:3'-5' exonuclease [Paenibacillus arenosi]|uniref:DNA 3'-5' helicase n=1 Tax=Paenibacillus arenosi TaxID=2774142 RepID=A0ABR9AVV5_9BACL|nr:AAA family ATPase [Paenibacillus arenosi]
MSESFQSAYQEEEQRLEQTLSLIHRQYDELKEIPIYRGSDFTEQVLEDHRETRRQRLSRAIKDPYFARMDVRQVDRDKSHILYIGKQGVDDEETWKLGDTEAYPLVLDWRAPVASLFYAFNGGEDAVPYETPEGREEAQVDLKRNLIIRQERLQRVADTYNRSSGDEHVNDEFLVYRLGENKDNKLRDIVSTIQAEQDLIIRAPKNKALFIQGVAGSGKTTVALHRLAFLLYQYQEQVRAERMIIFAPNRMFLDYISDVLPELGVGDIQQRTFADWALELTGLDERIHLISAAEEAELWYGELQGASQDVQAAGGRMKGSLAWRQLIQDTVQEIVEQAVPEEDFSPWDGAAIKHEQLVTWYHEEYRSYAPAKRLERVSARIQRWIEMELKRERSRTALQEKKRKSSSRLKAYMKKWPKPDVLHIYKTLIKTDAVRQFLTPALWKQTVSDLKQNNIRQEDLTTLTYIHTLMYGVERTHTFDHIVIDEAQDFSPLHLALLNQCVRSQSFTVLGDLSQGIHAYAGIESWGELRNLFQEEDTGYFELRRSYRSTMEIIEFANVILERGITNPILAEPVFRSGEPVQVLSHDENDQLTYIEAELNAMKEHNFETTALLTRTTEEARQLATQLRENGWEINLMDGKQDTYAGGISVLPVYLSKGLEFDAVTIVGADSNRYGMQPLEARLLYVGCTRALHRLSVLYAGTCSPLINSSTEE